MDEPSQPPTLVRWAWLWGPIHGPPKASDLNRYCSGVLHLNQRSWKGGMQMDWVCCHKKTCLCPYTRDITRLKNISAQQSLRCHILQLLCVVKETIQAEPSPKFTIVFDGWTEGSHHYIGNAAAYMKVGKNGKECPVQTMLSMKPLAACRRDQRNACPGSPWSCREIAWSIW